MYSADNIINGQHTVLSATDILAEFEALDRMERHYLVKYGDVRYDSELTILKQALNKKRAIIDRSVDFASYLIPTLYKVHVLSHNADYGKITADLYSYFFYSTESGIPLGFASQYKDLVDGQLRQG